MRDENKRWNGHKRLSWGRPIVVPPEAERLCVLMSHV